MKTKREFQPGKLYKLIRNVVSFLTVIFLIVTVYMFSIVNNPQYQSNKLQTGLSAIDTCKTGSSDQETNDCFNSIVATYNFNDNLLSFSEIMLFVLPITFFGGVGIYKHLFPVKK